MPGQYTGLCFQGWGKYRFCPSASPTYRAFQLLPQPFGKGLVLTVLYASCCFKLQLFKGKKRGKKEEKKKKEKRKKRRQHAAFFFFLCPGVTWAGVGLQTQGLQRQQDSYGIQDLALVWAFKVKREHNPAVP